MPMRSPSQDFCIDSSLPKQAVEPCLSGPSMFTSAWADACQSQAVLLAKPTIPQQASSPYSISSPPLSRRQFLKALLLASMTLLPSHGHTRQELPSPPIWWLPLQGATQTPRGPLLPEPPMGLPGSIMKLIATTVLLEERLLSPNTAMDCRGSLRIGTQTFHCQHAHGPITLLEAIGLSCNLFFAQAAPLFSSRRFLQYAERFQLNQPAYGSEHFRFPRQGDALSGTSPAYALGLQRNLQPNAFQLLRLSALIAQRQVPDIAPSTWQLLQRGMRLAVQGGTAAELDPTQHLHIAAKTGTTQHGQAFESWLIGYFPFENPRYAFCARSGHGTAKEQAVPLAHQFLLAHRWP